MQVEDRENRRPKVLISTIDAIFKRISTAKTSIDTLVSNKTTALYYPPHMRASPSGKASASQADTRGFESRCPLQLEAQARHHYGAVLFSIKRRDSNPTGCERKANAKRLQRAGEGADRRLKPVRICEANTRMSRCPLHRVRETWGRPIQQSLPPRLREAEGLA